MESKANPAEEIVVVERELTSEEREKLEELREEAYESLSEVLHWASNPRGGNNFYGRILNGCGRRATEGLGTAAVTLTREGKYRFLWDPFFFVSIDMPMRIVVVVHEAVHIVLQHLERILRIRMSCKDEETFTRLVPFTQIAADMAANDIGTRPFLESKAFREYKEKLIFPEHEPYKFEMGKSFERYLQLLLEKSKEETGYDPIAGEAGVGGNGDKPQWVENIEDQMFPKHVHWWEMTGDMTDAEVERAAERATREAKKIVKKAVEQTTKGRGTVPGGIKEIVDSLLEEPTVPWEVLLHGMLKGAISSKLAESTAWPNTALMSPEIASQGIEPYPGFQKDFQFHIAIAVDTSGSVSNDEFIKFMSEIQGLQRTDKAVSVQYMQCDAAIQDEILLGESDNIENRSSRWGGGGTNFCPPFRRVMGVDEESDWEPGASRIEGNVPNADLFIFFTDGYAPIATSEGGPIPELLPPCPVIWVLTPSGAEHKDMGPRVIKIQESIDD